MSNENIIQQFLEAVSESVSNRTFLKISLGNYKGNIDQLKNIYIRRVIIKATDMLSFTYRYKTRDIVKNYELSDAFQLLSTYIEQDFKIATLFKSDSELIFEYNNKNVARIRTVTRTATLPDSLAHDKEKKRPIHSKGKRYLQELKLTDEHGIVFPKAQDKFRQINKYIEILSGLVKEAGLSSLDSVVDMGSGKGYLTFALYDYLQHVLNNRHLRVTGVEFRKDLVDLCNHIASQSSFEGLNFVEGTIENFPLQTVDILIALHACDTATDEAIYRGINANAKLIVVAPCCHKQIRKEIEKNKVDNDVSFLTKYGIFLERQAEMVTDGIRALILEYFGYKTKVFEFISDVHTPKNVLVVGIRKSKKELEDHHGEKRKKDILTEIQDSKRFFGIGKHRLEELMKLDLL